MIKNERKVDVDFISELNYENAKRLVYVVLTILVVTAFQLLSYIVGEPSFYGDFLILVKGIILLVGTVIIVSCKRIYNRQINSVRLSSYIVFFSAFAILAVSIVNTFAAQNITSDISIYLMVLMSLIAGVRMKPNYMLVLIGINYAVFAICIPYFQKDQIYIFSHIFNGALLNGVGFVIARMLYKYSYDIYKDRQSIDRKNKNLKELSEKDHLTGLYNKRSLYEQLEDKIELAKVNGENIYLSILDLDYFKEINDYYGHLYGDRVLREIGARIMANIRECDIAARYGGDEFVIIFSDIKENELYTVMERIMKEVQNIEFEVGQLSFSCGIAIWRGESSERLFERADKYMYDVKHSGKKEIKIERLEGDL